MQIVSMTAAYARDVVTWRYPAPYNCYDMTGDPEFLTDPRNGFYALVDDTGLIGFRSFGADGQVPGGQYNSLALDTGGGLRPELVGQRIGRAAIATGLAFGREQFRPAAFRVTVAGFNQRALRVVTALGFQAVDRFTALTNGRPYEILVRPEPTGDAGPASAP